MSSGTDIPAVKVTAMIAQAKRMTTLPAVPRLRISTEKVAAPIKPPPQPARASSSPSSHVVAPSKACRDVNASQYSNSKPITCSWSTEGRRSSTRRKIMRRPAIEKTIGMTIMPQPNKRVRNLIQAPPMGPCCEGSRLRRVRTPAASSKSPRRSCLRPGVKNEEKSPLISTRKRPEPPARFERVLFPLRERAFLRLVADPLLLTIFF